MTAEPGPLSTFWASLSAVTARELLWRMRGRRAFIIVTIQVILLSLLVVGIYQFLQDRAVDELRWQLGIDFVADVPRTLLSPASATRIGQGLFAALLVVLTFLILILAPALTSGGISLEREKQTLELLITTPISTLGLLFGKLAASLAYLLLLIIVSIPLMSVVFVFGGVDPADVVRSYMFLFALAFGLGAFGLFMSALVGRTQAATVLSYVLVFGMTFGGLAMHTFMLVRDSDGFGPAVIRTPPEALVLLNPLVADVDLLCSALPQLGGGPCAYVAIVTGRPPEEGGRARDTFWPRSATAYLLVGGALTVAATQLVSPTRRWGGRLGRGRRRHEGSQPLPTEP